MEGKFVIHRKILQSDIWEKPAYYLKIWIWILANAKWKTNKKGGQIFRRGEFLTTYEQIIKENSWKVGWRTNYLTKNEVYYVLELLRKSQRIGTRKTTRGIWIKVLNYDYFQLIPKHEANSEANSEANTIQTVGKHYTSNTREIQEKLSTAVEQGKRKDLKIIFLLASKKNITFTSKEHKQSFIRRNLRPAKQLVPYELKRIKEVMDFLNTNPDKRGGQKWTLETVGKFIDDDLNELQRSEEIKIPEYAKKWQK